VPHYLIEGERASERAHLLLRIRAQSALRGWRWLSHLRAQKINPSSHPAIGWRFPYLPIIDATAC